ncbi:alpha/beta hydrolase [Aureibaculum conchae]|uniref:alpha/beta hydrolase n=1 Tax=Aureibaculum sp. 2308TA14-22 TaxID=3108392 RepID=UPI00339295B2
MKLVYSILLVLAFSFNAFAQNVSLEAFKSSELSGELNSTRTLKIYVPDSYQQDSTRVYPLAIVLDAEYLFDIYVANSKLFAAKDKAPEQIVVGIFQNQKNERKLDCAVDLNSMLTETSSKFYKFIKNELIGYIEGNYRISPFRTIVGNTITANFINYFMVEPSPIFNAYVNINPRYSQDIADLFRGKVPTMDRHTYYYLNNGEFLGEQKSKSIETLYYVLKNFENENFKYKYDEFNSSTNISSIGQAIPGAMAHIFDMYSSISKEEFENNIADLSPAEAIEYVEKKYVEIQFLFGANLKIRQRDIFAIESIVLDKEDGAYLEEFGKMINRLYPESPIGDYYIGQYYETGNDYKRALKYYKNGFAKISSEDTNSDGYYQNVERVLAKQKSLNNGELPEEEFEEEIIESEEGEGTGR